MNIEWKRCAVVDGVAYPSVQEAKLAMLEAILVNGSKTSGTGWATEAAGIILSCEADVLNALTFTDASRPRARKANGAVRKSRKKEAPLVLEA